MRPSPMTQTLRPSCRLSRYSAPVRMTVLPRRCWAASYDAANGARHQRNPSLEHHLTSLAAPTRSWMPGGCMGLTPGSIPHCAPYLKLAGPSPSRSLNPTPPLLVPPTSNILHDGGKGDCPRIPRHRAPATMLCCTRLASCGQPFARSIRDNGSFLCPGKRACLSAFARPGCC
jgi:hypothetical protein